MNKFISQIFISLLILTSAILISLAFYSELSSFQIQAPNSCIVCANFDLESNF
ncbi:MAG: hypothetical protein ABIA04_13225 [Pseudomonadota bacterium]